MAISFLVVSSSEVRLLAIDCSSIEFFSTGILSCFDFNRPFFSSSSSLYKQRSSHLKTHALHFRLIPFTLYLTLTGAHIQLSIQQTERKKKKRKKWKNKKNMHINSVALLLLLLLYVFFLSFSFNLSMIIKHFTSRVEIFCPNS